MNKSATICDVCRKLYEVWHGHMIEDPERWVCGQCCGQIVARWLRGRKLWRECQECNTMGTIADGRKRAPCPLCTPPWKRKEKP